MPTKLTVADLFALIGEGVSLSLTVQGTTENCVAYYDGRNSIPKEFNDCIVESLYPVGCNTIGVRLDADTARRARLRLDMNTRDNIIWGEDFRPDRYSGGIRHFNVRVGIVRRLIDEGFLRENSTQNCSPCAIDFVNFTERRSCPDDWVLIGYAVTPDRDDCRVTIEGIEYLPHENEVAIEDVIDFANFARWADEFTLEYSQFCIADCEMRAWWD